MGGEAEAPATHEIAVTEFSRDRSMFDSGRAAGLDSAAVPLSGTTDAPDGTVIEARAVSVDDGGASSTGWQEIAAASGGSWNGTLAVPRAASWYRAEARVQGEAGTAQTLRRFGVGTIIFTEEQSNVAKSLKSHDARQVDYSASGATPVTVTDPEAVQIHGTSVVDSVNIPFQMVGNTATGSSAPITPSITAAAQALIEMFPGEKFLLVYDVASGTAQEAILDDQHADRAWAVSKSIADAVHADGARAGIFINTHARGLPPEWTKAAWFGLNPDGSAIATPLTANTDIGVGPKAEHLFSEIWPELHDGYARMVVSEQPWSLGGAGYVGNDLGADGTAVSDPQYADRQDYAALKADPHIGPQIREMALDYIFALGEDLGGSWDDHAHYSVWTNRGMPGYQQSRYVQAMIALGLGGVPLPRFDRIAHAPDGAHVDIWSSAGPVTTVARKNGLPPLDGSVPAHTEVLGFDIDGVFATRAEIVDETGAPAAAGRVRLYPGQGSFDGDTAIKFGENGGHGMSRWYPDLVQNPWDHRPIVDVGLPSVEGLWVQPPEPRDWFRRQNTLAGGSAYFYAGQDHARHTVSRSFYGGQKATIVVKAARFRFPSDSFTVIDDASGSDSIKVALNPNRIAVTVENGDGGNGTVIFSGAMVWTAPNALMRGLPEFRIVIDSAAGYVRLFVDDVEHTAANAAGLGATNNGNAFGASEPGMTGTGWMQQRQLRFFAGAGEYLAGRVAVYETALADGSEPASENQLYARMEADGAGGYTVTEGPQPGTLTPYAVRGGVPGFTTPQLFATSAATFEARLVRTDEDGDNDGEGGPLFWSQVGSSDKIKIAVYGATGNTDVTIRDSANNLVFYGNVNGFVPPATTMIDGPWTLRLTVELTTSQIRVRLFLNDAERQDAAFGSWRAVDGGSSSGRLYEGAIALHSAGFENSDIHHMKIWKQVAADGAAPPDEALWAAAIGSDGAVLRINVA